MLQDFGLVSADDCRNVIDPSKVRRERRKKRKQLQYKQISEDLCEIYFDGRKDKTLVNSEDNCKYYRRTVTEEHYSLLQEPGSSYLGWRLDLLCQYSTRNRSIVLGNGILALLSIG